MVAFHGQMGMFTRALAYILSHGADGLKQVAEDAVLNANYVLRSLADVLDAPFAKSGPCMHEAIFSDRGFAEGVSTIDLAKALIDEGFHPMTMYFPLVVHGAMLIEPTETELKASLDQFITAVRSIAGRAKAGDQSLKAAPVYAPRRRLDETLAARKPVLTYRKRAPKRPSKWGGVRMQVSHPVQQTWLSYAVTVGIIIVVLGAAAALAWRRCGRSSSSSLWIVPALYLAVAAPDVRAAPAERLGRDRVVRWRC